MVIWFNVCLYFCLLVLLIVLVHVTFVKVVCRFEKQGVLFMLCYATMISAEAEVECI